MITGFEVVPSLVPLPSLTLEEKSLPPEEKIIEPVSETIEVKEDDTIQGTWNFIKGTQKKNTDFFFDFWFIAFAGDSVLEMAESSA